MCDNTGTLKMLMSVIRGKCMQCSTTRREIERCNITDCALYPFRMGKIPEIRETAKPIDGQIGLFDQ